MLSYLLSDLELHLLISVEGSLLLVLIIEHSLIRLHLLDLKVLTYKLTAQLVLHFIAIFLHVFHSIKPIEFLKYFFGSVATQLEYR